MKKINAKLDKILNSLQSMSTGIDNFEMKIESNTSKLTEFEKNMSSRCRTIEKKLGGVC